MSAPVDLQPADPVLRAWYLYRAERALLKRVAHDLSNNLTGIVMALEAAAAPTEAASLERTLATATAGTTRAVGTNTQLRELLKEPEQQPLVFELSSLLREAVQAAGEECPSRVRMQRPVTRGGPCHVRGNSREVLALLIHLLLNAMGSAASGELAVELDSAALPGADFAEISILLKASSALAPFGAPDAAGPTAGMDDLALTISRQVIAELGGRLDVEDTSQSVRRVKVSLPRVAPELPP